MSIGSDVSNAPVIVLSGYGISITVERGHLSVEDGVGNERRTARFSRANSGIKRVVVLGHLQPAGRASNAGSA